MKPRVVIIIVLSILSLCTVIGYQALKSSQSNNQNPSPTPTPYTPSPSTPPSSGGEELNKQGQRRPPQYLHICDTANSIEYVSQGNPKCLGNDTYTTDYDPSVPGTVYSSPCRTNSGTLRYVYISNDETCPSGTTLLFYNSLGGSTTGPSPAINNSTTTN